MYLKIKLPSYTLVWSRQGYVEKHWISIIAVPQAEDISLQGAHLQPFTSPKNLTLYISFKKTEDELYVLLCSMSVWDRF